MLYLPLDSDPEELLANAIFNNRLDLVR
jgi:hypothetical protein